MITSVGGGGGGGGGVVGWWGGGGGGVGEGTAVSSEHRCC